MAVKKSIKRTPVIPEENNTTYIANVPAIDVRTFQIILEGDSPLISHAWSDKAKKMILDKQTKAAKSSKEAKNPWMDFCDSLYWLTPRPEMPTPEDIAKAKFGFPVVGFKEAAVSAGYQSGITKNKVISYGAFHIVGDFVEIIGTPEIREDMVRVGMGVADIRYRGEFKKWQTTLTIRYNAGVMSMEQIINLFNLGGFACGVGEWRPSKGGSFGMFHVK